MTETKKNQPIKKGFKSFLARFPSTNLPLTLSHGDQSLFSKENKPLSPEMAFDFLWEEGDAPFGEFTEFVACFRLPETKNYHAVVYWKGDMLDYHFYLAIFDKKGEILEKNQLAGTKVHGELLEVSEAEILTSWDIKIRTGSISSKETNLSKATLRLTSHISIEPTSGKIIK